MTEWVNLLLKGLSITVKLLALSFVAYKDMVTILKFLRLRNKTENGGIHLNSVHC